MSSFRAVIAIALCALASPSAQALSTCSPLVPPPIRYVGNVANDSQCTDDNIQHAIDNIPCQGARILITGERTYTQQALTIQDKTISLTGSASACGVSNTNGESNSAVTAPVVTIDGSNRTHRSVLTISGTSNVTLQFLEIKGGNQGNGGEGGGILFNGKGSLVLDTITVDNNHADYGAGIDVSPSDTTNVTLLANTLIVANTAAISGGGIRIEGDAHLLAASDQTDIAFNKATSGYGGGILVLGPASANIGSPGYGNFGVINNNSAAHGGGIALFDNQSDRNDAVVKLFTTDPHRPVTLQNNTGTINGGAMYAKPKESFGAESYATFCAFDSRITGNSSPEGAAFYLDYDTETGELDQGSSASQLTMADGSDLTCGTPPPANHPVACAAEVPCNEISDNIAEDNNGNLTAGAAIFVTNGSYFSMQHGLIRKNTVANLVHGNGGGDNNVAVFTLRGSLAAGNIISGSEFLMQDAAGYLFWTTVAHDFLTADQVFDLDDSFLYLHDAIIAESGPFSLKQVGSNILSIDNVLANDVTTLPPSPTTVRGDPLFVDASNGNFHLLAYAQNGQLTASPAIDFAALSSMGVDSLATDLDGRAYDQDAHAVVNRFGPHDLGAYEMQPLNDRIFGDAIGDRLPVVF